MLWTVQRIAAAGERRVPWAGSATRPPHETPSDSDWYTEAKIQSLGSLTS
jgi:hypothetical protein